MATDQSDLFLKKHVESTTNYNKQMEETALNYLGERKEEEEVCVECELCGVRVPESLFYKHVQIHRTRKATRPLDM